MSLFCLVHGSTQSSAGWKLLVSELQSRGHYCICVDLPTDQPDASANVYADAIASALRGLEIPIVVAHSASGLFLPLLPIRMPVARLVFLAAVMPQPRKSFFEQYQADPKMYRPDFVGKDPTKDDSLALHYLFHDCGPEVASWAFSTLQLTYVKQALLEPCPVDKWPGCTGFLYFMRSGSDDQSSVVGTSSAPAAGDRANLHRRWPCTTRISPC